jgi:hypothetical protein
MKPDLMNGPWKETINAVAFEGFLGSHAERDAVIVDFIKHTAGRILNTNPGMDPVHAGAKALELGVAIDDRMEELREANRRHATCHPL